MAGVFWWYWSFRRRVTVAGLVLLPVVGLLGFRLLAVLSGDDTVALPAETSVPAEGATPETTDSTTAPQTASSDVLLLSSAANVASDVLPLNFRAFDGQAVAEDLVLPGAGSSEFSYHGFFPAAPGAAGRPAASEVSAVADLLAERFRALGGSAVVTTRDDGFDLRVAGVEGGRGFQTTIKVFPVRSGVVVQGNVKLISATAARRLINAAPASAGPYAGLAPDTDASTDPQGVTPTTTP